MRNKEVIARRIYCEICKEPVYVPPTNIVIGNLVGVRYTAHVCGLCASKVEQVIEKLKENRGGIHG